MTVLFKTWTLNHFKVWKSWLISDSADLWLMSFSERLDNRCLICTRKKPYSSINVLTTPLFFCFKVLFGYGKKTLPIYQLMKRTNSQGTAVWKLIVNRQRGHMLWKVHLNNLKETLRLWSNQKCMFCLACFTQWRDSSQWSCCAKLGGNHISTIQWVFVVSLTLWPLMYRAVFISWCLFFFFQIIIHNAFYMRKLGM